LSPLNPEQGKSIYESPLVHLSPFVSQLTDVPPILKKKSRRPTAIFSMSDRMALGALQAAIQLGLEVPGDLSIVGFDDIPQAAGSKPALTTVRQSSRAKGQMAAAIVVGDLSYTTEFHQLATELIVRESVGAPGATNSIKFELTTKRKPLLRESVGTPLIPKGS
jgi:ABC-type sugar transport system substrate-binding protein